MTSATRADWSVRSRLITIKDIDSHVFNIFAPIGTFRILQLMPERVPPRSWSACAEGRVLSPASGSLRFRLLVLPFENLLRILSRGLSDGRESFFGFCPSSASSCLLFFFLSGGASLSTSCFLSSFSPSSLSGSPLRGRDGLRSVSGQAAASCFFHPARAFLGRLSAPARSFTVCVI